MAEPEARGLEAVAQQVAELRDLFHRRLLEDRAKNQAIDLLRQQHDIVKDAHLRNLFGPVFRDLLVLVDRLTPLEDEVSRSIVAEVEGLLLRYGVRALPLPVAGEPFDPLRHNCVVAQESDAVPPGHILAAVRTGYALGAGHLRFPEVVVAQRGSGPSAEAVQ